MICCYLQATLDETSASLAQGATVVCLFVNDNANAQVCSTQLTPVWL